MYRIDTGEILAGMLPRRQQRLVEAWIELYREELLENWQRINASEPIQKIPPSKMWGKFENLPHVPHFHPSWRAVTPMNNSFEARGVG